MGGGMARNAIKAGFPVTVYNRTIEKAKAIEGATIAKTPREAAAGADVIVSMLADDNASRALWLGPDGAISGAARGAVLVECSTVTVEWVNELAAAAQKAGCELIDAPVTGSKVHAAAGELNFIVGGSEAALEKARPVLKAMSKTITHLGPIGSGALLKLINNFVCGVQLTAYAEALAWVERAGLDRARALPIMTDGAPGSPLVKTMSTRMTTPDFTPNFVLKLLAKDMRYAIKEAGQYSINLVTAPAALELMERAIKEGFGDKDMSAVVEPLREQ